MSERVIIIGSGPAGLTAAIYAARAALKPLIIQGLEKGGQLSITTDVENYPGFADPIQGPWLMEEMQKQAENVGTRIISDRVKSVDFSNRPFSLTCDGGETYKAEAVIIATGATAKWLGVKGEQDLRGFGVSACATCDGFFYRGRKVAVIGGGNTAVEEALYLTHHADEVTLIHRRDSLRAEKILQERMHKNPKIKTLWHKEVIEMVGNGNPAVLSALKLKDTQTGEESLFNTDGVFVAIGHQPATEIFKEQIKCDDHGYIITKADSTETNIKGVFAAGDVKDHTYRQAVTAAGMGCMAALETERFLAD